jgi:K+-sensing histidine kinase KdpD
MPMNFRITVHQNFDNLHLMLDGDYAEKTDFFCTVPTAIHDMTRGGLSETLSETAYLSGVGMEVDASLDKELLELSEAYQSRAMKSGIKLELRNEKSLPFIKVDPHRMRRVFTNLLDNAFKCSTKGGTITIITEETAQEVMIRIRDEGQGIDLIAFESFFERGRENHSRHRLHLQTAERG